MNCILPLNDFVSQGSRQGTLLPELLNLWYEQHAYHKILPSEYDLSMKILRCLVRLDGFVLPLLHPARVR
jgi:hypothetical protein